MNIGATLVPTTKENLKHTQNASNFFKYNNTKMKRALGYIFREPQIILQRAAGWPPLLYSVYFFTVIVFLVKIVNFSFEFLFIAHKNKLCS